MLGNYSKAISAYKDAKQVSEKDPRIEKKLEELREMFEKARAQIRIRKVKSS